MDPTLVSLFTADLGEAIARRRDDHALATARQRDSAAYDMRVLNGAIAATVLQSDDAQDFAHLNAGVRVPTTLDHPNAVVTK